MKEFVIFAIALLCGVHAEECPSKQSNNLLDQDFGIAITPTDLLSSVFTPWSMLSQDYFRPWRRLTKINKELGSTIKVEKDKFQINLDVQHFSPEEITVKVSDGYVVIDAKHEEKQDEHGFISRQFVRRYSLPAGTEEGDVVSELSSDGILKVTAPRKVIEAKGERVVPITKTGPAKKEAKAPKEVEEHGSCKTDEKNCDQQM